MDSTKYGKAAVKAYLHVLSGKSPEQAWHEASCEIFGAGTHSQRKSCPKGAFLGLCSKEMLKGIPQGNYSTSVNGEYAVKALDIVKRFGKWDLSKKLLWNKTLEELNFNKNICPNNQIDVVLSLFNQGYTN